MVREKGDSTMPEYSGTDLKRHVERLSLRQRDLLREKKELEDKGSSLRLTEIDWTLTKLERAIRALACLVDIIVDNSYVTKELEKIRNEWKASKINRGTQTVEEGNKGIGTQTGEQEKKSGDEYANETRLSRRELSSTENAIMNR